MDRLRLIKTFVAVAQARSFTAASEGLRISRTSVTKQVAALETSLQRKLFNRTTHSVNLTEAGAALLDEGKAILQAFDTLEARVRQSSSSPRGVIRIGTPPSFGALQLIPAIREFKRRHPDIEVALFNDDGVVDLIKTGLDFTIRIADALRDTSAISRLLTRVPQVLVAAPDYLDAHGVPIEPEDLLQHNCLVHVGKAPTSIWRFRRNGEQFRVRVSGSMSSNFGEAIRSAALLGDGIAMHPTYMVDDDLRAGRLRIVMNDYEPTGLEIRAMYARKELPARVGLFLSFFRTWLRHETSWPQSSSEIDRYGLPVS
jgi:DNA-binding transcriptional LysR family regulator